MGKSDVCFKVPGGLGNQLFAYFSAVYVAEKVGSIIELDFSSVDRSHHASSIPLFSMDFPHSLLNVKSSSLESKNIHPLIFRLKRFISRFIQPQGSIVFLPGADTKKHVDEFLNNGFLDYKGTLTVEGYFGDFSFFDAVDSATRAVTLKNPSSHFLSLKDEFISLPCAVVHHRLGDFLGLSDTVGLLDKDYYETAFELSRELGITRFRIFTNDLLISQKMFLEWGFNLKELQWIDSKVLSDPLENLLLMGNGKALITSNSTFSFWAGRLASEVCANIYYPSEFRRDRLTEIKSIPNSWIPIKSSWSLEGSN